MRLTVGDGPLSRSPPTCPLKPMPVRTPSVFKARVDIGQRRSGDRSWGPLPRRNPFRTTSPRPLWPTSRPVPVWGPRGLGGMGRGRSQGKGRGGRAGAVALVAVGSEVQLWVARGVWHGEGEAGGGGGGLAAPPIPHFEVVIGQLVLGSEEPLGRAMAGGRGSVWAEQCGRCGAVYDRDTRPPPCVPREVGTQTGRYPKGILIKNRGRPSWDFVRPSPRPSSALLTSGPPPPPQRQGPKMKKNRSVFDENTFFETATKSKNFNFFFHFWGSIFWSVGARKFSECPDPSKNE